MVLPPLFYLLMLKTIPSIVRIPGALAPDGVLDEKKGANKEDTLAP